MTKDDYRQEFFEYNKQARRDGLPQLQFKSLEEYINYREGRGAKMRNKSSFKPLVSKTPARFIRQTKVYPSAGKLSGTTPKVDIKQYSGDYLIGIATMHKSNLVPVGRDANPVDYSTMRRS